MKSITIKTSLLLLSAVALLNLSGCGGSDGGSAGTGPTVSATNISGTAAAGAPIIGNVTVKGSQGNIISKQIEADGSYSVDVSTLTAPYMLRAVGYVGGNQYTLHSYAKESDVGNTINITPFTDLIVANAAKQLASTYFDSGTFSLTDEEIASEQEELRAKLITVLSSLGIANTIDLLRTAFTADHSGLDAALDIVRVDVDTATSVATLTNLIDNTTIVDNLVDNTQDTVEPLAVVSDLGAVATDYTAINNRLTGFNTLFATSLPTPIQLGAYLGTSFLHSDLNKEALITELTTDPSAIGLKVTNSVISDLNLTDGTAKVTFSGLGQSGEGTWYMEKVGNAWYILGNQEVADIGIGFQCIKQQTVDGTPIGCGVNITLEDIDTTNNNAQGAAIRSAKVTLVRDGLDVPESAVYLSDANSVGQLYIVDEDTDDDYLQYFYNGTETAPDLALPLDGDTARFDIYDGALTLEGGPQVSGNLIASYTRYIPKAPVSMAEAAAHAYPVVAQSSIEALDAFTTGNILIEWTLPSSDIKSDLVWLRLTDNITEVSAENSLPSGATSTNFTLDTSTLNGGVADYWMGVYSKDAFEREFTTQIFPAFMPI